MFQNPLFPSPLNNENLRPVFWKSISGRLPAWPWTLVRLDLHSIHVTLLLKKTKQKRGSFFRGGGIGSKDNKKKNRELKYLTGAGGESKRIQCI